ncbi:hypothetical protein SIN8267_03551 [Sinobacterium norvegicum]|uniref:Probable membrane transporter protein n=1 Tax=Sinobacterium norvegicum TaxID=1641715 RepID=A0ABM9AJJ1_9GAMM|nr:TSUP family transporter [Sinobacterium norvegicum]CAH0993402.1 hypothetical protein SIN8267_03551 [Sinobacterium norvegicum]
MTDLSLIQYGLIAIVFVWSGFVRSGLGFGGAVLSLPFLLLIDNRPLVFLPLIAFHLLFFSSVTLITARVKNKKNATNVPSGIDWPYFKYAFSIIIIPKIIGVLGLVTLPTQIMSGIIFAIVTAYALSYIFNKPFSSNNKYIDVFFLMLGGYISGTSLIGAPLIIAVMAKHVSKYQLRDTLFLLWFVLVTIKMATFIYLGIDLQLVHHLWLLPAAGIGHIIGLRFHQHLLQGEQAVFYRVLGSILLIISSIGLYQILVEG